MHKKSDARKALPKNVDIVQLRQSTEELTEQREALTEATKNLARHRERREQVWGVTLRGDTSAKRTPVPG